MSNQLFDESVTLPRLPEFPDNAESVFYVQLPSGAKALHQPTIPIDMALAVADDTNELTFRLNGQLSTVAVVNSNAIRTYKNFAELRRLIPAHEMLRENELAIIMGNTTPGDMASELWKWNPASLEPERATTRDGNGQVTEPGIIKPTYKDTNVLYPDTDPGRWCFVRNQGGAGDAIDTTQFAQSSDVDDLDNRVTNLEGNQGGGGDAAPGSNLFIDFAQAEPANPENGDVWIADGWAAVDPAAEPFQGQRAERVAGAWVFTDIPDGTIYHRIADGAAFRIES